jgi:hypothetical protein
MHHQEAIGAGQSDSALSRVGRKALSVYWWRRVRLFRTLHATWPASLRAAQREAKGEMARALSWRLRLSIRVHRWNGLFDIVRTLGRIAGVRGVAAEAQLRTLARFDWLFRRL